MPTKIEWATDSWNPISGCTPISEGCQNCYAKRMAQRLAGRYGYPRDDPFKVTFHPDQIEKPLKWNKPRRIFVCSMGDLFHRDVDYYYIRDVFHIMDLARHHTFMLLTKRPFMMMRFLEHDRINLMNDYPHIMIGVTVETNPRANERIPILLTIPAAVRFVSFEPALSSINIQWALKNRLNGCELNCPTTKGMCRYHSGECSNAYDSARGIDWVICGAETGPKKRPMDLDWARSLRDQCQAAGVPFFFKKDSNGNHELDGQVWEQFPKVEKRASK